MWRCARHHVGNNTYCRVLSVLSFSPSLCWFVMSYSTQASVFVATELETNITPFFRYWIYSSFHTEIFLLVMDWPWRYYACTLSYFFTKIFFFLCIRKLNWSIDTIWSSEGYKDVLHKFGNWYKTRLKPLKLVSLYNLWYRNWRRQVYHIGNIGNISGVRAILYDIPHINTSQCICIS